MVDLIVNRSARLYARDPRLLDRVLSVARHRADVVVTSSLAELGEVCRAIAARGSSLVLLAGGDGTLMAGVSALADAFGPEALPPIGPVPGGTAGTVARNWGIVGDPARYLQRLLAQPRTRHDRPSLRIVSQHGASPPQRRIGFIVGTGLVASFFRLYYDEGAPGYAGSARLVARIFAESFVGGPLARRVLTPMPLRLEVDGTLEPPEAWSLVCCAVVRNLGIHMLVTYRAGEDPDRPHLVATPMSPRQLGPRAPLVLAGKPIGGRDGVDRLVRSFTLRFDGEGSYVLDGELFPATTVEVSAGPQLEVVSCP